MAEALAVISLIGGVSSQRKSRREQRKASKSQQRRADLSNARSRRATIARARALRASTIAQGEAQGISGGSQVQGAAGSVISQGAGAVSFANQIEDLDQNRFRALDRANTFSSRANTFRAIGGNAENIASIAQKLQKGIG